MKNNIKKNFVWNVIGSMVYAFNSLFFMIIVTRINGVEEAGVFTFAFSFACMFQVVGAYAGRTYQVTERDKKICDYDYIYQRIITCLLMFLIGLVFIFIKEYTFFKILVILLLLLYRVIDAYSEVLYGIFQKNNHLYKVGMSLFFKSFIGLICFLLVDILTKNIICSICSLIVINFLVLCLFDYRNVKKYKLKKKNFDFNNIKMIFIGGFSVFIFTFLTQYVVNASKYAIDDLMTSKFQTIFGIILMPATLMSLCSQLIIHPFLFHINKKLQNEDYVGFRNLIFKICFSVLGIGLFAILCCYFLAIPILEFLYSLDLNNYLNELLLIVVGSIFCGISTVFSNALVAIRKNKVQIVIYGIVSIFSLISSYILVDKLEIFGASLAYLFAMILLFILYLVVFLRKYKGDKYEK